MAKSTEVKPDQLLLSVPQVAQALNITERFVWNLLKAGEIKRVRVGRRSMVTKQDLLEFIERNS